MRKWKRILALSLVACTLVTIPITAAPDPDAIREQKNAVEEEVSSLQEDLQEIMTNIAQLEEDLIAKGEEIIIATEDLEAAELVEEQQYQDMLLRIKYMYEEGKNAELDKIFNSKSIADFLNQAEYVETVQKMDRDMLEEYKETKETVAALKTTLEEEMAALELLQADFEAQKVELDVLIEEKKEEVADLAVELQAAIEAVERERREREERERLEREAAEQAERERQAQEANRVVNNSNNNSNNGGSSNSGGSDDSNTGGYDAPEDTYVPTGNGNAASAIVSAAYSQLGVPYVWGGTSAGRGLDCSGLTQFAHRQAGISIPRTSGPQGAGGQKVSSPQPGDIVCYSGHVGIYIGGGQMIHAPQPGDVVRVASVYGSPWYRRYW